MDLYLDDEVVSTGDPLETVEAVIGCDERFACERAEDGDVHFSFKCSSGETVGYFSMRHELPALLFTLGFDIQAPISRRAEAVQDSLKFYVIKFYGRTESSLVQLVQEI